ncbi:MAG: insulinase family protein [Chloroflexota bacterium]|nr:insulinase family protein [Chloroflexota bacterium]
MNADNGYGIDRRVLPDGIVVLARHIPDPDIIAVSIGVRAGARFEDDATAGASKFMEKLYLQGTERRPGPDLVQRPITVRGGTLSVANGSELVTFGAQVRSVDTEVMLDVLADVLLNSTFAQDRVENEGRVILEELNARRANPNILASDLFFPAVFDGHPLARSSAGDLENTPKLTREQLLAYRDRFFVGRNTIVAVAGNLPADQAHARIAAAFGSMPAGVAAPTSNVPPPAPKSRRIDEQAGNAQARVLIGGPLPGLGTPDRFALSAANAVLGGSGFRLFREIRDLRGLSYDPSPGIVQFPDAGVWLAAAGTDPVNTDTVIDLLRVEIDRLSNERLGDEDLANAKNYLEGSLVVSLETPGAQSGQMIRDEAFGSPVLSHAHIEGIRAVTADDVQRVAREYLRTDAATLVVVRP